MSLLSSRHPGESRGPARRRRKHKDLRTHDTWGSFSRAAGAKLDTGFRRYDAFHTQRGLSQRVASCIASPRHRARACQRASPQLRGWRAEKRKSHSSRSFRDRAGASRRATCAQYCVALPRFAHLERMLFRGDFCATRRAALSVLVLRAEPKARSEKPRAQVGRRPVAQHQNVSQLLAGPLSGPGRSPGAARVLRCERNPQAPRPVPRSRRL
jgi:hypothetical protein